MPNSTRRSREEILAIYRACRASHGKVPGRDTLCKVGGVRPREIQYYWPSYSALVREAGDVPNPRTPKLPEEFLFGEFAQACRHAGRVVSQNELRILERELGVRTSTIPRRFNRSMPRFRSRFRRWLEEAAPPDDKPILEFEGWNPANPFPAKKTSPQREAEERGSEPEWTQRKEPEEKPVPPGLRPMLPAGLQYLDVLARGERPPFGAGEPAISTAFENKRPTRFAAWD